MPQKSYSTEIMQQALNLVVKYGSPYRAQQASGIPDTTLGSRSRAAQLAGLKPTVERDEAKHRPYERLGRTHMVIPDVQAKHGVPLDHMEWAGNYAVDKKPDVIVQIGDFADVPSLNSHGKPRHQEMQRYQKDMAAVIKAQELFLAPIDAYNRTAEIKYTPRRVITKGNHENRITRIVDENPWLEDKVSENDLGFEEHGWEIHDFLEVVNIDGIEYSHYFTSGVMGRAVPSAAVLLRERQCSATMGHVQNTDMAFHKKTQNIALFCGIFYQHNEDYLGPQGNATRRQIVMKHEVDKGRYDPMFVSLNFLKKRYS